MDHPSSATRSVGAGISLLRPLGAWRFGQLAAAFPLLLLVLPYLPHALLVKGVMTLFLLNMLLVADVARPHTRKVRAFGWTLWGIATLGLLIEDFVDSAAIARTGMYLGIGAHSLLIVLCAANIVTVSFRAARVSLDGIFASIVAYELLGLFFAQMYTLAMIVQPGALHLPDTVISGDQAIRGEMIYFSFVTLATLGYGDIVPATDVTRALAIMEAVIGQFYVAIVVAILVSQFVAQRLTDSQRAR